MLKIRKSKSEIRNKIKIINLKNARKQVFSILKLFIVSVFEICIPDFVISKMHHFHIVNINIPSAGAIGTQSFEINIIGI